MRHLRHIAQTGIAAGNTLAARDLPEEALGEPLATRSTLLERLADLARCW